MRYAVVIEKGPTSYRAYVPDLPGCVATGESEAEVRKLISEAVNFNLERLQLNGEPIPAPSSLAEYIEGGRPAPYRRQKSNNLLTNDEKLDQIGNLLQARSAEAVMAPGPVREFLDANPLPEAFKWLLPDEFRAFCLALNSLKQWVSAEQLATDRYLFGGTARERFRQAASSCVLTGQPFGDQTVQLHHPVRDGRPPIPVIKAGHEKIEGQASDHDADPRIAALRSLREKGHHSWIQLRCGCQVLDGGPSPTRSRSFVAASKTFARNAKDVTGMSYPQLLE